MNKQECIANLNMLNQNWLNAGDKLDLSQRLPLIMLNNNKDIGNLMGVTTIASVDKMQLTRQTFYTYEDVIDYITQRRKTK